MDYPKAPDKKIQKLSNLLTKYVDQLGVEFCFDEKEIYSKDTFAHFGCLSLFLLEAKEKYEKLYNNIFTVEELMEPFGAKIKELNLEEMLKEQEYLENLPRNHIFPIEFHEQEDDTYFGFIPRIPEGVSSDFLILAHFTQYTVDEYIHIYQNKKTLLIDGKVPLDLLYQKLENKINAKQIEIIPQTQNLNKDINSSFDN